MIGIFLGSQNSGKTLVMTSFAYDYYKKGYKIYSNYNLNFPYELITSELLKEYTLSNKQFNKVVFLIDEINIIFDSRNFGKKSQKIFTYFILQSSKRNVNILGTTQQFNTIEKRFRENVNFKCYCNRVIRLGNKYYFLQTNNRKLTKHENHKLYIKQSYIIFNEGDYGSSLCHNKIIYLKAEPYFGLYDTRFLVAIE